MNSCAREQRFQAVVRARIKGHEYVRQQRFVEHEKVLEEFRFGLQEGQDGVLKTATKVRKDNALPAPKRRWDSDGADPVAEQVANVDLMCLALESRSLQIKRDVLSKYRVALKQKYNDERVQLDKPGEATGFFVNLLHAREKELLHQIDDYYWRVHEADEQQFEDIAEFYDEATNKQADQAADPLLAEMNTLRLQSRA